MFLVMALVGVVLAVVLPPIDAFFHGPLARRFNQRYQQIADQARLVGRPEADVVTYLGAPTYIDASDRDVTYNYAPISWLPTGKFQVHCSKGIVVAVEQLDR
jgi:hypothetical protein